MQMGTIDIVVVILYAVAIFGLAQWVSRDKVGAGPKNTTDYFLASKNLPWWAIGASLIAANISAEQIVGMAGSGYKIGLAIASYEWMAAATLLLVGKYFLPIFLKNEIYTMPQFLERRYGRTIRTLMAFFWLALYVFVNLTSIIWLGSIAVTKVAGARALGDRVGELLAPVAATDAVVEVRRLGTMAGVEVRPVGPRTGVAVCRAARRRGVWLRPLGDTVVLMPPLALGSAETELMVGALAEAIAEVVR